MRKDVCSLCRVWVHSANGGNPVVHGITIKNEWTSAVAKRESQCGVNTRVWVRSFVLDVADALDA